MTPLAGFEAYTGQHFLLLAIFAAGAVGIVLLGPPPARDRLRHAGSAGCSPC